LVANSYMQEKIEEIIKKYESHLPSLKTYGILEKNYDSFIEELMKLIKNDKKERTSKKGKL